jgi:peptidoglycan/xylan/chitin deacetylase (PgdA/CDA1 family)
MQLLLRCLIGTLFGMALQLSFLSAAGPAVPILVYHRFGPARTDSMTVTTEHFKEQMDLLCKNNFSAIPLADLVAWRMGKGPAPPPRSVVLTIDDGHESVYREARSIVVKNHLPVTLFIYPSCISHASYAMSWEQLTELAATPFFTVQSHTLWHPNFKQESKKLDRVAYAAFVDMQLGHSKTVVEEKLQRPVVFLAWPFGIYDRYLTSRASAAGYEAGFSIDCRAAAGSDPIMALPRCLVSDEDIGPRFLGLIDLAIWSARN